jgi:hypothetical protein
MAFLMMKWENQAAKNAAHTRHRLLSREVQQVLQIVYAIPDSCEAKNLQIAFHAHKAFFSPKHLMERNVGHVGQVHFPLKWQGRLNVVRVP